MARSIAIELIGLRLAQKAALVGANDFPLQNGAEAKSSFAMDGAAAGAPARGECFFHIVIRW